MEVETYTVTFGVYRGDFPLAAGSQVYHLAGEILRHQYGELFYRFAFFAVYLFDDYFGLADLQLIAFPAHGLYKYGQVQNAAAIYYVHVRRGRFFHP